MDWELAIEKTLYDAIGVTEVKGGVEQMTCELHQAQETIARLTLELEEAQREIEMRKLLLERAKEDAERTFKGFKNKLAYDLHFEYVQYKNVIDAPMTAELGEIMRDQLRTAFRTLHKSGVNCAEG